MDGEKMDTVTDFIFLDSKIIVDGDCSHEIKTLASWKKNYEKPRQRIKQRHHFADKGPYSQGNGFSSSQVWMWELDHKEGWTPKNWFFQNVVLDKTLESPLDIKETKPVSPKGNKPWIFIGRDWCWSWSSSPLATWCKEPTHCKRPCCWERLREWRGTTEDEMVEWPHGLNGHEFEQTLGDSEGQGSLECCSTCGRKELDTI